MVTVKEALTGARILISTEKEVQLQLAERFTAAGLAFEREVRLSKRDTIDFLVGSVGVEVKIKGAKRAIFDQLRRYTEDPRIGELVLVTAFACGLPREINGKPVSVFSLGAAWL